MNILRKLNITQFVDIHRSLKNMPLLFLNPNKNFETTTTLLWQMRRLVKWVNKMYSLFFTSHNITH